MTLGNSRYAERTWQRLRLRKFMNRIGYGKHEIEARWTCTSRLKYRRFRRFQTMDIHGTQRITVLTAD